MVDKAKVYNRRNEILSVLKPSSKSGSYRNCVRISNNPKVSWEHEKKKFDFCFQLVKAGCEVFTEAEFDNGCVCDILCIDTNGDAFIYEIVNTETEESIANKRLKYPYPIIEVKV